MADSGGIGSAARAQRQVARAAPPQLPVYRLTPEERRDLHALVEHEWLVTNGIGGYSSSTVAGMVTRRYHGLLVAALANPLGRMVMFNALLESAEDTSGRRALLSLEPGSTSTAPPITATLTEFRLDGGIPVWRYSIGAATLEKRVFMPHRQNTVIVLYRVSGTSPLTLHLTPAVHFRYYEAPVSEKLPEQYVFRATGDQLRLSTAGLPPLHLAVSGSYEFIEHPRRLEQIGYAVEEARGYEFHGSLWSPGTFVLSVSPGQSVALVGSTDEPAVMQAMSAEEALAVEVERKRRLIESAQPAIRTGSAAQLVIAADEFIIRPVGRVRDTVRAAALGEEVRTVIAGYHWFTDWGRDTMISLEGLTLVTGRYREAGYILRTFSHYVRDGLIPNLFPDGSDQGLYHTADATLWFFHAFERYAQVTGDWWLVQEVLPVMREIIEAHLRGTRFGIGVDPADGLLRQGADGYQLTWMDAKVDDWVVTARRGKAVEINALWYNALCLLARWECDLGDHSRSTRYSDAAAQTRESFNQKFWFDEGGYLYDVVEGANGNDSACRPNQLLAISLPHPVLDRERWSQVVQVVQDRLLTPVGLRSLAPGHPDFKPRYFGDLRTRDAAYHQGTVWAWLIGPWIDAWLKLHPDDHAGARRFLDGLIAHLAEFGVGSIAEIFDAEEPYTPRGCIAQAWSVAEVLRCLLKTDGVL
ncbi:MAG TPA: amylo-alpha-1,6-glucosidase [Gemmatimonadales bacterium]|nr:amylo-alpha-1,6-glucosidase [Gemmatimonadales bacterium]